MDYTGKVITKNPVTPNQVSASGVWTLDEALQAQKGNNWPVPGVYNPISRSLRFNSADSTYLNRTPTAQGNLRTWTWSGWVKRSAFNGSNSQYLFSVFDYSPNNLQTGIRFTTAEAIQFWMYTAASGYTGEKVTSAVYRDMSAWYHIVATLDTTNATANDRMRLYINGVQVTAFSVSTNPAQNTEGQVNRAFRHVLGAFYDPVYSASPVDGFNGYMTEVNFIDGQALTPSDFGLADPATGVWVPKKYTGTYGTNGFYLNFKDNSNTTTIGYDYSGNGNNWNANNFSVTAGAGNDSLTDVPTLWLGYSTSGDTGGVVRGNYCTWNPFLRYSALTAPANGNLDISGNNANWRSILGTVAATSGKWYAEITIQAAGGDMMVGVFNLNDSAEVYQICNTDNRNLGRTTAGYGYQNNGNKYSNSSGAAYGATYTTGDILGIALDLDGGTVTFYKNGSSQGQAYSGLSGNFTFAASIVTSGIYNANFGQRPFAYTPPAGYRSLCTTNLPTPAIGTSSTTLADDYFNTVLYTGTGSTLGVTGVGFQPDFVWIKSRSAATDHALYDIVRGDKNQLESNTTTAETNETTGLTGFNADGFTVGSLAQVNTNTATYVGWNWKAGGVGVSNTAGSISSTVSANTTAGFSIVTYTGTGSNATVGHGCLVNGVATAPSMIIVKRRDGATSWRVYHTSIGNTGAVYLNTTVGTETNSVFWNNTSPTSSVFTVGTDPGVNGSSNTLVAYCFAPVAGYSAFGSFTGNGSTDGAFVYTGFRPAWVMIKVTNEIGAGGNWGMFDNDRLGYNSAQRDLRANLSNAEGTENDLNDLLSNGFKIRSTSAGFGGGSGNIYIYAAFAEFPFKFSNAR